MNIIIIIKFSISYIDILWPSILDTGGLKEEIPHDLSCWNLFSTPLASEIAWNCHVFVRSCLTPSYTHVANFQLGGSITFLNSISTGRDLFFLSFFWGNMRDWSFLLTTVGILLYPHLLLQFLVFYPRLFFYFYKRNGGDGISIILSSSFRNYISHSVKLRYRCIVLLFPECDIEIAAF